MPLIHLIATPRNVSTALMYSFAQRADTKVIDEPFYAHYLVQSGKEHPGRAEVLRSQPHHWEEALADAWDLAEEHRVVFMKGMAHHMYEEMVETLSDIPSVFLTRDPKLILASYTQVIAQPNGQDIGVERQWELIQWYQKNGLPFWVIDANRLLENPASVLQKLTEALYIGFDTAMLKWQAGPLAEDGVWARHWYKTVHASTGFGKPKYEAEVPPHCQPLYERVKPVYDQIMKLAI